MKNRELYSIRETRELLGGISRNSVYGLLRTGALPSVVIGCRRFISAVAISQLIAQSTTTVSPSQDAARLRSPTQCRLPPLARTVVKNQYSEIPEDPAHLRPDGSHGSATDL
ncbi:MAG: hypothetical protein JWM63_3244 [Gammaproteobacteria bacterium]|jgi:hypothetical protein|nr:hypothetical protein [Gammaproteobacteria bacterium]